jgi:hypothetical protein
MSREQWRAVGWGLFWSALLAFAIYFGSHNLRHIDAALVGYTFACLFATFAIAYRYAMWLQRPPTRLYWRRGWQAFTQSGRRWTNLKQLCSRLVRIFLLNVHIWKRSRPRGFAHLLIMWGCIIACAITFPLVFGWLHFETVPGDLARYRTYAFGIAVFDFQHESLFGEMVFHGLVWASVLVIAGVFLALQRRLRDHGAAALQDFREDIFPLFLLFAVSITGVLLTVSYSWMKGYAYEFLAILHAVTVIFTLLWLPFGKFFHIFQRPAQLGVSFYRDAAASGAAAKCVRCDQPFADQSQIDDLIQVERELGYDYQTAADAGGHYQHICPACRRKMFALANHAAWFAPVSEERAHGR